MSEPCFLDTNILMYAVGSDHPFKNPCLDLLKKVSAGDMVAVTDTEVFQEIAYRYWSQRKWSVAVEILRDYQCLFSEIYPVEQKHLGDYYSLLTDYDFISPRDAIHIAVMRSQGLKSIWTTDRAFQKIPFLKAQFPGG